MFDMVHCFGYNLYFRTLFFKYKIWLTKEIIKSKNSDPIYFYV